MYTTSPLDIYQHCVLMPTCAHGPVAMILGIFASTPVSFAMSGLPGKVPALSRGMRIIEGQGRRRRIFSEEEIPLLHRRPCRCTIIFETGAGYRRFLVTLYVEGHESFILIPQTFNSPLQLRLDRMRSMNFDTMIDCGW